MEPVVIWFAEVAGERGGKLDHPLCGSHHNAIVEREWRPVAARSTRLLITRWTAD